jgi:ABC-type multidrug transport system ATPase subunit
MLGRLKAQGLTILASTPYMDEAGLCDRIALVQNGEFMTVDTPANIIAAYPEVLWSVRANRMHNLLDDLRGWPGVKTAFSFGESVHITADSEKGIAAYLEAKGYSDIEIKSIQPTVEDCFMQLSR